MKNRRRDRLDNNKSLTRRLYNEGLTDVDIALEMEVTRAAVSLWRKRNGLPRNSQKGRTYATWHHRAVLLLSKGWTLNAVAEHVGQNLATVKRTLRRKRHDPLG